MHFRGVFFLIRPVITHYREFGWVRKNTNIDKITPKITWRLGTGSQTNKPPPPKKKKKIVLFGKLPGYDGGYWLRCWSPNKVITMHDRPALG